ncbi:MAG: ATP-grasp domain-containing protein [Candidatus Dormibacteraeota bacterium]|nr:ATP-grasp domain-containing protein [Candidatus Dormibacteraeota bacterium]
MAAEGANARDPVVLVVGSGAQRYREYLLTSMASHHHLWLLSEQLPTWQAALLAGNTVVDVLDPQALVQAATEVATSRPVRGVVCYDEALILSAAEVVAALGLPGMSPETVTNCRDKLLTREVLSRAGIPQPCSIRVHSLADAALVAAGIGYPVVLKPRNLGASEGVVKVNHASELADAFRVTWSSGKPDLPASEWGVLVEEFLDGPEISVDGAVFEGRYSVLVVAHKQVGLAPYFEETEHVVAADDPLFEDEAMRALLDAAHRALGVAHGMTHTEIRLTARGPRIVEVNGRIGGDLIPLVGWLATGIDPGSVAIQLAIGEQPEVRRTSRRSVGIRFCYPEEDCRVVSVAVPDSDQRCGLVSAAALASQGTVLCLPPTSYVSRHAYVICEAPDPASCHERLAVAAARVTLASETLTPVLGSARQ